MTFIELVAKLEQALDEVVNVGSDDELFIASYLQGHLAVIAKPMEIQPDASLDKLMAKMQASLAAAFEQKELEANDQQKVLTLWQTLTNPHK